MHDIINLKTQRALDWGTNLPWYNAKFKNVFAKVKEKPILRLTQHSPSHQDVEQSLGIASVVKLCTRGIKELCDSFQISASLVQTLYNAFLKLGRVKPLLFICAKRKKTYKLVQFIFISNVYIHHHFVISFHYFV